MPTIIPTIRPTTIDPKIPKYSGRSIFTEKYEPTIIITELMLTPNPSEDRSCFCVAPSLVLTRKIPITDAIIPIPAITIGRITAFICKLSLIERKADAPNAADASIEPAYDSYRSAPIPATSPTLSPTLSAMVAGFLGSSSGIPASTFPTRSAPTSAALVKIPPPTLAKRA